MGATHENDIEGYDTSVTAGGMQEVLNKGLAVAPGLADSTLLEVRVGFRPFTPGFLPVLGAVPGWKGLFAANGLGASGLTVGPYVGNQLAKLVLGMETYIDLQHYDLQQAMSIRD
ncbi:D-amino acid dehydrogenase small subunit [compost metagenome]